MISRGLLTPYVMYVRFLFAKYSGTHVYELNTSDSVSFFGSHEVPYLF